MKRRKRYVLDSVTGWPISANVWGSSQTARIFWYVLDSAIGYRTVREFRGQGAKWKARELADRLNADHDAYLETIA